MRITIAVMLLAAMAVMALARCGSPADDSRAEPSHEVTVPPVEDPAAAARLEEVRKSLAQGLDVNRADAEGRTLLMIAAFDGRTDVVRLLLEEGAEVDQVDHSGLTALIFAASGPFPQTVELLIDSGADVNHASSSEGWTALMMAAAEGQQAVVKLLLERGADIEVTDLDGDTAIDHARQLKNSTTLELLESWAEGS